MRMPHTLLKSTADNMQKVFIDTDIALDLLTGRQPHYDFAAALFTLADRKKIRINISSLSFSNLNYILGRELSAREVRKILLDFKVLVNVLAVDDKIIHLALNSDFNDLEDAIQHFTALQHNIPLIITRNIKDYKKSHLPVFSSEAFIKGL